MVRLIKSGMGWGRLGPKAQEVVGLGRFCVDGKAFHHSFPVVSPYANLKPSLSELLMKTQQRNICRGSSGNTLCHQLAPIHPK